MVELMVQRYCELRLGHGGRVRECQCNISSSISSRTERETRRQYLLGGRGVIHSDMWGGGVHRSRIWGSLFSGATGVRVWVTHIQESSFLPQGFPE